YRHHQHARRFLRRHCAGDHHRLHCRCASPLEELGRQQDRLCLYRGGAQHSAAGAADVLVFRRAVGSAGGARQYSRRREYLYQQPRHELPGDHPRGGLLGHSGGARCRHHRRPCRPRLGASAPGPDGPAVPVLLGRAAPHYRTSGARCGARGRALHRRISDSGRFGINAGWSLKPEFLALLLGLSIYTGAFIAEIVRSGINAVSHGQTEAAHSLGLRPGMTTRLVILPQALRVIVPPLTSQYLNLTKNSSLATAIGYPELTSIFAGTSLNQTGQAIEVILIAMLFYLSVS